MDKLFLRGGKIRERKTEVEIDKGNLILLKCAPRTSYGEVYRKGGESGTIGVYTGLSLKNIGSRSRQHVSLEQTHILRRASSFGIALVEEWKDGAKNVALSGNVVDMWAGQNDICKALRNWEGFEVHEEWVRRLKKMESGLYVIQ